MTGRGSDIDELLERAHRLPAGPEREAFLDQACAGRPEIRQRLNRLLLAADDAASFLERPAMGWGEADKRRELESSSHDREPAEDAGDSLTRHEGAEALPFPTRIGPYKLLQKIGEGGMGTVWMAEQTDPVRRIVALKLIKPGMDSRQVIARFEAERQALSLMDHPHIAKVLDAGTVNQVVLPGKSNRDAAADPDDAPADVDQTYSRPFFVMELVKGQPITQYCDERRLTPRERLELFVPVCHAIQHAHQKGIIHRDIKPTNVLVAEYDHRPVAKVIDFGVAKAISQSLTEKTMFTELGQLVGTLEYMSPEQAKVNQLDIDTRSDVYSLGVLLYELLTGGTPLDRRRLRSAAWDEMLRIIREEEPLRPSTRLSSSETLPSIAANRRTEPARLSKLLRGELDWVVMKALEKDRGRRYATANALAVDLQRFLADEPVEACPPSTVYRLRKLFHRHRVVVLSAFFVVAALLFGTVGTTVGLIRAQQAERQQAALRARAERGEADALEQAARADREADIARGQFAKANRAVQFMEDMIEGVGPSVALGRDTVLLKDILDDAAQRLANGELSDAPEAELALRLTLGRTYREIADYRSAQTMLDPAVDLARQLAGDQGATLELLKALAAQGWLLLATGQPEDALQLYEQVQAMSGVLMSLSEQERALVLNDLAAALIRLGRYPEAMSCLRQALELMQCAGLADHRDAALIINNLGHCLNELGRYDEGLQRQLEALAIRRRWFAGDHPRLAVSLNNVAISLSRLRRHDEALTYFDQSLEMRRRLHPGDHPDIARGLANLAASLQQLGRTAESLPLLEESLQMRRRLYAGDHPDVANNGLALAVALTNVGRHADAENTLLESLAMFQRMYSSDHPNTARALHFAGTNQANQRKSELAVEYYQQALAMRRRLFENPHPSVAQTLASLATQWLAMDRAEQAEPLAREALAIYLQVGDRDVQAAAQMSLARAVLRQGTLVGAVESESLLRSALETFQALYEPGSRQAWRRFHTQCLLGRALTRRAVLDDAAQEAKLALLREAESQLLDAWAGLRDDVRVVLPGSHDGDPRAETLEGLVHLYEHLSELVGDADSMASLATWRDRLQQYRLSTQAADDFPTQ